ncbi:MAG: tRNA preQ1(34) S-adenosylmethionine ribosyltransferase-isomerase QueA [Candidatus Marinimicrobia bacterium]|nr:tRNA preQ1(34) S-adenosylmethionine ribosyltransferase-isomerase QueA [Candidatus Neomarinimicrobiota bacterium]
MTKFEIFNTKPKTYRLSDFQYPLPEELIASYPTDKRGDSRLMALNRDDKSIDSRHFDDILDYFEKGDCLVMNNTKVFPARLFAKKDKTDADVEVFLLRALEDNIWEVLVKPARKVRIGNKLFLGKDILCDVIDNTVSGGRVIRHNCSKEEFMSYVMKNGKSPLPPYIKRDSEDIDKIRYQTVFAEKLGAVAAPTAGLHFTDDIIEKIKAKGVKIAYITLHIGLGTFRPVLVEDLSRHTMDSEYFDINKETADTINESKRSGKKVFAVGTSSVRALESSIITGTDVIPNRTWTDKFIYPPYQFKVVDTLITNFHQEKSTLIMLVSAFSEKDLIMKAYAQAIEEKYRFFSYGDAMIIL